MGEPSVALSAAILGPIAARAEQWLDGAFSFWHARGLDRDRGGFHERLSLDGAPTGHPRRAFVQARQAYCFCEAGRLGWTGAWLEAALHARAYLFERYVSPEGAVLHTVDASGCPIDTSVDLYDVAFLLFALAHLYDTTGRNPADRDLAIAILDHLRRERAHPRIGFVEASADALRQNPHMHLLEAALAWIAVEDSDVWWTLAEELVALAERHLIDEHTGAIFEHFTSDWMPLGGREAAVIEPGHQHEWAYLLAQWDRWQGREPRPACRRLFMLAEAHGRDPRRGVAVHDVDLTGRQTDGTARIWAQTERLRTAVTLLPALALPERAGAIAAAVEAGLALNRFLDAPISGLWRDKWRADGSFVEEAVPASTFYHIVTGYSALIEHFGTGLRRFAFPVPSSVASVP